MVWSHVTDYFLDILYKSGMKDISEYPKRHPMCHGSQLNFDTKEMNLKLIMCMQILCELAWNVRCMKEENAQVVIDV